MRKRLLNHLQTKNYNGFRSYNPSNLTNLNIQVCPTSSSFNPCPVSIIAPPPPPLATDEKTVVIHKYFRKLQTNWLIGFEIY